MLHPLFLFDDTMVSAQEQESAHAMEIQRP
jgi:hypothetical protein